MPFQIIRNDITKVKVDAIVNTANPNPTYGSGIDGAIYKAAGEQELLAERKKIGVIKRGEAVITPAFNLRAKYIIHTVGPVWEGGAKGERELLRSCYEKSLSLAADNGCKSVAMPLISTGTYGFPQPIALEIAMSVSNHYLLEHDMDIFLVVFGKKAVALSEKIFQKIDQFIDENYEADVRDTEYGYGLESEYSNWEYRIRNSRRREEEMILKNSSIFITKDVVSTDTADMYFSEEEKTFQQKFFEHVDASGMKDSQIYYMILSKAAFSNLRSDIYYQPSKKTAVAFCIRLKLSLSDTEDLLERAGFVLSKSSMADMIVKGAIVNNAYDFDYIDTIMEEKGLPMLLKY